MLVEKLDKIYSLDCRQSFGYSCGFGDMRYGKVAFGFFHEFAGIYSRKKTLSGWGISRMKFYAPTNPRTIPQQSRRSLFASGISSWQGLTLSEREAYNVQGRKSRMSGINWYMKKFMMGTL